MIITRRKGRMIYHHSFVFPAVTMGILLWFIKTALASPDSDKMQHPSTASELENHPRKKMNVDVVLKALAFNDPNAEVTQPSKRATENWKRFQENFNSRPKREALKKEEYLDPPIVLSSGPGWVELRLGKSRVSHPRMHTLRYRAKPPEVLRENVEDLEGSGEFHDTFEEQERMGLGAWHVVEQLGQLWRWGPHAVTLPPTPCPSWIGDDLFCALITDGLRLDSGERFRDFQAQVITRELKGWRVGPVDESTPIQETLNFTFRVWQCDPTLSSAERLKMCSDIGRPPPAVVPPPTQASPLKRKPSTISPPTTERVLGVPLPRAWVRVLADLWPLYVALLVLLITVGVPLVFIRAKRNGEREAFLEIFSQEQMNLAIEWQQGRRGEGRPPLSSPPARAVQWQHRTFTPRRRVIHPEDS